MPDVPDPGFIGVLSEIWFGINYAAYHLAYVGVYSQSAALQTPMAALRQQGQTTCDQLQADVVIFRAHVAAFFWQLDHIFEALRIAIVRGQQEQEKKIYFWEWETKLKAIEETAIRKEISAYRNQGHQFPAIIGCNWTADHKFVGHFLPTIEGHEPKESTNLISELDKYFQYVAGLWLSFLSGSSELNFPRDFKFPVSVPYSFIGDLPPLLKSVPHFEIAIELVTRKDESPKQE